MLALRIAGGIPFGAPEGWDPDKDGGNVHVLYVAVFEAPEGSGPHAPKRFVSAWQPNQEEMLAILAGGTIYLQIIGMQPPVALWVEAPPAEDNPYTGEPGDGMGA